MSELLRVSKMKPEHPSLLVREKSRISSTCKKVQRTLGRRGFGLRCIQALPDVKSASKACFPTEQERIRQRVLQQLLDFLVPLALRFCLNACCSLPAFSSFLAPSSSGDFRRLVSWAAQDGCAISRQMVCNIVPAEVVPLPKAHGQQVDLH